MASQLVCESFNQSDGVVLFRYIVDSAASMSRFANAKAFVHGILTKLRISVTVTTGKEEMSAKYDGLVIINIPRGKTAPDGVWHILIMALLVNFPDPKLKLLCVDDLQVLGLGIYGKGGENRTYRRSIRI